MAYVRLCSQTLLSTAPNLFLSKTRKSENMHGRISNLSEKIVTKKLHKIAAQEASYEC